MYMKDWVGKFDEFLQMTEKKILQSARRISHVQALSKAGIEYEKYKERTKNELSEVEKHFVEQIEAATIKIKKTNVKN